MCDKINDKTHFDSKIYWKNDLFTRIKFENGTKTSENWLQKDHFLPFFFDKSSGFLATVSAANIISISLTLSFTLIGCWTGEEEPTGNAVGDDGFWLTVTLKPVSTSSSREPGPHIDSFPWPQSPPPALAFATNYEGRKYSLEKIEIL